MEQSHDHNLSTADVAAHYALTERTVRDRRKAGDLHGVQIRGLWRFCWHDVWAAQKGPMPKGEREDRYKEPLLSKKGLAAKWGVCIRTIERCIEDGLPTRNVFGNVRIAPSDAEEWRQQKYGKGEAA